MTGKIILINGGVITVFSVVLIFFLKYFIKKAKDEISADGNSRLVVINQSITGLSNGQSEMKTSIKEIGNKTNQIQIDIKDYIPRKECQDNKKDTESSIRRVHERLDTKQDKS